MISWIQEFTQKNHKLLFGTLLIVIIIAFVFTIGNLPTFGRGSGREAPSGDFYGYDLGNQQLVNRLFNAAELSAIVNGQVIRSEEEGQYALASRMLGLYMADALNIPEPEQDQTDAYVRALPAFSGQDGEFAQERYLEFLDQLQASSRYSEALFYEAMQQDWRIDRVERAMQGPGYVLPYEVMQEIRLRRTKWSVDVATIDYADFQPEIELSDEAIETYYEKNMFRYEIPPRAKAAYVFIPSARFLEEIPAQVDEQKLREFYQANRGRFPDKPNFEAAQGEVSEAYRLRLARERAITFASEQFVYALYDQDIEKESDAYARLLETLGLQEEELALYTRDGLPEHEVLTRNLLDQAFDLTRYYSDPYPVSGGVAVLILKEILPAEVQPLQDVREAVAADLRESRRRDAFIEHGAELRHKLQQQTEDPARFPLVAAKLGLSVQPYRDFSLQDPPEGLNQVVVSALTTNEAEEVSEMITRDQTGYFVYIVSKEVPEIAADDPQVQQFMSMMKTMTARRAQSDVMNELIALGTAASQEE